MNTPRPIAALGALALLAAVVSPPAALAAPSVVAAERIVVAVAGAAKRTESAFSTIHAGMPVREVVERLGEPDHRMRFERTRTTAWDYDFRDTWGYRSQFSVVIDEAGRVVETITVREDA